VLGVTLIMNRIEKETFQNLIETNKRICEYLNIPFEVFDVCELFRKKVIEEFVISYLTGKTPNPCVNCNRFVKFDFLLSKAKELGATKIATGHYAQNIYDSQNKLWLLKKAVDRQKDQSYFLYTLNQDLLPHILFPLGNFTKNEVRKIAQEKGLSNLVRPESQDICFIFGGDYIKFIKEHFNYLPNPGPIVDQQGKTIGYHKGIIYYTIGQRKRIGISNKKPLYVVKIDYENNVIVVGEAIDVYKKSFVVSNVNFIYLNELKTPLRVYAKIRNTHEPALATLIPENNYLKVIFDKPQWAITPGQAAVFYEDDLVLGGGIIVECLNGET
ncbi:MAG: tRNA 2-thiouridine(34) synthase MnmA, partial [candidate division WOR-3 bacterium]|nr:tRNA 2-thiouridine(34) synthase MnmA [candidate division WOR-3 bacterium]